MERKFGIGIRVIILKNNKVLLGKRRMDLEKANSPLHGGGTWTLPGGKVEFGENLEEAVEREVLEEAGIRVENNKLVLNNVSHDQVNDIQFVTLGFVARDFSGDPNVTGVEVTEWQWFDLNELPDNLYFASAGILHNYLNNTFYRSKEKV